MGALAAMVAGTVRVLSVNCSHLATIRPKTATKGRALGLPDTADLKVRTTVNFATHFKDEGLEESRSWARIAREEW